MAETPRRKLTTILCADVAGYSRLMDRDEAGTLARLMACREAIDGLVARHQGRVVNTAGDSLMAEFGSVVEAVQCAAEVQRELAGKNADLEDQQRMLFRIGINLGDVMVAGDDLYGEGVNIAARLQGLAEPGGICISGTAYDQVHNKLTLGYDFIGEQAVKNIAEEVPVYRVLLDAVGARVQRRTARATAGGDGAAGAAGRGAARPPTGAQAAASPPSPARTVYRLFVASLALLLAALVTGALAERHFLGGSAGKIEGDVTFVEDRTFKGSIGGNAIVAPGVSLRFGGEIDGNLILGPGAVGEINGKIEGDVINHGGVLRLRGKLDGSERQEPPEAYPGPPAVTAEAGAETAGHHDARGDGPGPHLGESDHLEIVSGVLGLLFLLTLIAGVIVAYIHIGNGKQGSDGAAWLDSHYRFQIRTFWIGLLALVLGGLGSFILIGFFVLALLPFWLLIRCVRGWRHLARSEPHPNPASWLLG